MRAAGGPITLQGARTPLCAGARPEAWAWAWLSPPRRADPRKRGCDEPGETTATPRLEADPGDLHAARCPHGRPDPRPTAPLPMARPNPR